MNDTLTGLAFILMGGLSGLGMFMYLTMTGMGTEWSMVLGHVSGSATGSAILLTYAEAKREGDTDE